jgi:uncharacterized DUF497 family protein
MRIEFDPRKDAANIAKHGVSLAQALRLEWDTAVTWPDFRKDYGEERMSGIAYIGLRLYVVVYVNRMFVRRIISLRKANPREMKRYAKT